MKIQNRVAGLVFGLVASVLGTAASVAAQPAQNYVFGSFEGWRCYKGRLEIKLQTTPFIGRRNEDGTMPKEKFEWVPTDQTCDEITPGRVTRLFKANGRATYLLNEKGRITGMGLF